MGCPWHFFNCAPPAAARKPSAERNNFKTCLNAALKRGSSTEKTDPAKSGRMGQPGDMWRTGLQPEKKNALKPPKRKD